ncbi:MAG TPA: histidine kinase [Crocinitomicaceae bacterium]|nr:histidine kinase [Crocinitomicaceae bacterium]
MVLGQSAESYFPFSVSAYNAKDGLPQNQVIAISEWQNEVVVSTMNGLASFNGIEFTPISGYENFSNIFYNLSYDKSSQKLFGLMSSGEYCQILPHYKKLYYYSCVQTDGNILNGISADGLIRTTTLDVKNVLLSIQTNIKNAIAITQFGDYYFVADGKHLYKVSKNTGKKQILLKGYYSILKKNPYTNELIAINGDVHYIDENYRVYKINPLIDAVRTDVLFRDAIFLSEHELLVTSSRGLYHIKNDKRSHYNTKDGLMSGSLYGLYHHPSDNCIFVGTENNGAVVLKHKKVKTYYTTSEINLSQSFTSVVQDKQGAVYSTASKGNIIKIDKKGNQQTYAETNRHVAALAWVDDNLYVGTFSHGLFIYRNGILVDSIHSHGIREMYIQTIFRDSEKNVWIGSSRGVFKQHSKGSTPILKTGGNIVSAYELRDGTICFGSADGFFIVTKGGKQLVHVDKKDGLKGKEVRCFYEDEQGCLWIGTYGGGLYVYEKGRLTSINSKLNCELNKDVFTLVKSEDGYLYMSSNEGIWAVSEQDLQDFYRGKLPYLVPEYYGEEVGIKNTEFNGGFCNNYLKQGQKIWFPSINGLVEFSIGKNLTYQKSTPKFKSIIVNDTIRPISSDFGKNIHSIQFDFYFPTFSEQKNIYYQYKLSGENSSNSWSPLQKSRQVILKMLPPGKYTFYVRAIDSFNDLHPQELAYQFTITPYFYETTTFYVVLVLVAMALIFFAVRFQNKRIERRNNINNMLLELKLKAIQSKMNPHFMFNTLNNIVFLLTTEKYKEAERLLEDFSLLLRRFLEKNDDFLISLKEELEMIELYLFIQQKRYNNSFDYQINTDVKGNEKCKIPSMLIQPFVENAIIHGIAHSDKRCKLEISVKSVGNNFEIRIEDSGIGRKKSAEINRHRERHTSHGIRLIEDKIKIMNQKYGLDISFQISDIEEENRSGTIVQINIPIIDYDKLRNY